MNTPSPVLSASFLSAPEIIVSEFNVNVSEIIVPEASVSDLPSARTSRLTLAHLLMVIAIVGMLSALAAPILFPVQP